MFDYQRIFKDALDLRPASHIKMGGQSTYEDPHDTQDARNHWTWLFVARPRIHNDELSSMGSA